MPHDGVGAAAIADWLVEVGVRDLLVVHDHDHAYGVPVTARHSASTASRRWRSSFTQ